LGQHHLVSVDVAVVERQLLGMQIRDGDLRQETHTTTTDASNVTQADGAKRMRSDMIGRTSRTLSLNGEQVTLPADDIRRVVAIEDRGVGACVLDPQLPVVAVGQ
jgi:hypothetical protein